MSVNDGENLECFCLCKKCDFKKLCFMKNLS